MYTGILRFTYRDARFFALSSRAEERDKEGDREIDKNTM